MRCAGSTAAKAPCCWTGRTSEDARRTSGPAWAWPAPSSWPACPTTSRWKRTSRSVNSGRAAGDAGRAGPDPRRPRAVGYARAAGLRAVPGPAPARLGGPGPGRSAPAVAARRAGRGPRQHREPVAGRAPAGGARRRGHDPAGRPRHEPGVEPVRHHRRARLRRADRARHPGRRSATTRSCPRPTSARPTNGWRCRERRRRCSTTLRQATAGRGVRTSAVRCSRCKGLDVGYGKLTVARDITFTLPPRTVLTILGPNGAGKTTLLMTLAGFLPPRAGQHPPERPAREGIVAPAHEPGRHGARPRLPRPVHRADARSRT